MPIAKTLEFVAELIDFIADLAAGTMTIEKARKRAAELLARKPEMFSDQLLEELEAKIAKLEKPIDPEKPDPDVISER